MKLFRCKQKIDPIENVLQAVLLATKDLSPAECTKLCEGVTSLCEGCYKVRNVKTNEEKAIEKEAKKNADIDNMEKIIKKELKKEEK